LARQLLAEPDPWLKNSSRLVGAQVETVESSFAERKKTAIDQEIDDVMEKAPFTAASQDIEELQAATPEEEQASLAPAADDASGADAVSSATDPAPPTHEGDQAYL
jgi:hypothetical protein